MLPGRIGDAEEMPPFTAFGSGSRLEILGARPDPLAALDWMGQQMQRYRSWGHRGQVNGRDSEQNFKFDHDWSKDPQVPGFRARVPRRIVFGLPQNYSKQLGVVPAGKLDRRGSPLLLHVHALGLDSFAAVAAILPAEFLPSDNPLREPMVDVVDRKRSDTRRAEIDWRVLHDLLDGPVDPEKRRANGPYFPEGRERLRVL